MKKIVRYSIPNIFTAASLLLGFSAIITSQYGNIEQAAWMIVWCGILDVMDGLAARLLNATSPFGAEFDSMADLVSFGVAPAIIMMNALIYVADIQKYSNEFWIISISVSAFVLAGALRLARYNITSDIPIKGWFTGLPITGAGGGLAATAIILLIRYQEQLDVEQITTFISSFMMILTVCMVSTFKFPIMFDEYSGKNIKLDDVEKSLKLRDFSDKNRKESPLLFVKGAVLVDTTNLTLKQMNSKIVKLVRNRIKQKIDGNI